MSRPAVSRSPLPLAALAIGVLPALLAAQSIAPVPDASPLFGEAWRVPIHADALDHGPGPERWAAARSYKASFHDGFTFYPVLGPDAPEHLPFAWRTVSVRAGGAELVGSRPPVHAHEEWRYEYRHPGFVEAYDVRSDGVEQTFTFFSSPGPDELVVRGRVVTELVAPPVSAGHQSLVFRDSAGSPVVEYGAATVIDAAGRRLAIDTRFDGAHVDLRVPAEWLEDAVYPVVVDPFTFNTWIGVVRSPVVHVDLAREGASGTGRLLMCLLLEVTANDRDVFAYETEAYFANPRLVYSSTGTSNAWAPRAAFVQGPDRWVIAYREVAPQAAGSARIFVAPLRSPRPNTGTAVTVPGTYGDVVSVGVGGSRQSGRALVGFVSRIAGASASTWLVYGAVVDCRLPAPAIERYIRFQTLVRTATQPFPRGVAVNRNADNDVDGWALAWLESTSNVSGTYVLWAARGYWNGQRSNVQAVEIASVTSGTRWRGDPVIDGAGGRYMVAYRVVNDRIRARRLDWPSGAGNGTAGVRREHAHLPIAWNDNTFNIAFDHDTRNHWALAYREPGASESTIAVERLGHTGGSVESASIANNGTAVSTPGVSYDPDPGRKGFAIVFHGSLASRGAGLIGNMLYHRESAFTNYGISLYGTGCGGTISATSPFAGHGEWKVRLTASAAFAPAVLLVGTAPASTPYLGGCFVNVDLPSMIGTLVQNTNEFGISELTIPLPDAPAFVGDLYLQWAYVSGGQVRTTRGLLAKVRP